ncbi:MAG: sensor histidine kinase [Anaerolineae bacterium]|nr:sensor histidine kinase [Anaerolineae bacterium]
MEDFVESLGERPLIRPGEEISPYRDRLTIDVDEGLYLMAPREFLNNIFHDLLRNAFMYSEPGTPVIIRGVSASQGRHVEFSIIDQGYGIRAKETDRIFEPFSRARQPQVLRATGYGLSLYLVKSEIEALGGRIWFESEEGVGATFSFKLPAYVKEGNEQARV